MRRLLFALAIASSLASVARYATSTRPLLAELRALDRSLDEEIEARLAAIRKSGVPPSAETLARWRAEARDAEEAADRLADRWFRGAKRATDYLVPRSARPRPAAGGDQEELRPLLETALIELPLRLKEIDGLSAAQLGLLPPSLSRSLASSGKEWSEQLLRVVIAGALADALRSAAPLRVESFTLESATASQARIKLALTGPAASLVAALEALATGDESAPPRIVDGYRMLRQPPEEWPLIGVRFPSPPQQLELTLRFLLPVVNGEDKP